ncbi:MAG: winged helix-turn-helix transcriptional regulator, partial [Acidobacteriota bacterium]
MNNNLFPDTGLFRTLEEITRHPAVKPQELADKLALNLSTVKNHVRKLRLARLVISADRGRQVKLNADYGYMVGIDMGASHLHYALADFCGQLISDSVEKVQPESGPRKTIAQIKKGIRRMVPSGKRG